MLPVFSALRAFAASMIASIRREVVDHVIVVSEPDLTCLCHVAQATEPPLHALLRDTPDAQRAWQETGRGRCARLISA